MSKELLEVAKQAIEYLKESGVNKPHFIKHAESVIKNESKPNKNDQKEIEGYLDAYLSMDYIPYNRVIQALKKALKKAENKPHMTIEDVEVDVSESDDEVIMERLTPVQEMEFTPVTRFCEMCGIEAD